MEPTAPEITSKGPTPRARVPEAEPCDDPSIAHDLAALEAGTLDADGRQQLAEHVVRCDSCRELLAGIIVEAQRVQSTGTHGKPEK